MEAMVAVAVDEALAFHGAYQTQHGRLVDADLRGQLIEGARSLSQFAKDGERASEALAHRAAGRPDWSGRSTAIDSPTQAVAGKRSIVLLTPQASAIVRVPL